MNSVIRKMLYALTYKRVDEDGLNVRYLTVGLSDISCFKLSTNSILSFQLGGQTFFFRECPRIIPRKEFFCSAIDRFFEDLRYPGLASGFFGQELPIELSYPDEICDAFKKYIDAKKSSRHFLKKLASAKKLSDLYHFSIWENKKCTHDFLEKLELGDIPERLEKIAVYFAWCMRSASIAFETRLIARGQKYAFFSAVRMVSSYLVAEALGIPHMITETEWCILDIDGDRRFGVMSTAAPGTRMLDRSVNISGELQRELTCLNALDLICFQVDHGPNNYSVCDREDNGYLVCAFDNDNPYTFCPLPLVSMSFSACAPLINKDGTIARPYFDYDFAKNLESVDRKGLRKKLQPYLNGVQIEALLFRMRRLERAIRKTQRMNPQFLLHLPEWNRHTAECELTGKFGVTYYTKIMEIEMSKTSPKTKGRRERKSGDYPAKRKSAQKTSPIENRAKKAV